MREATERQFREHYYLPEGDSPNLGQDEFHYRRTSNRLACNELKERLDSYFRRWEIDNGFRPGAGLILVPAGWQPKQASQAA